MSHGWVPLAAAPVSVTRSSTSRDNIAGQQALPLVFGRREAMIPKSFSKSFPLNRQPYRTNNTDKMKQGLC
jgi:hypothetical protein